MILNEDEVGIQSIELSIQLSSNRDIDSFLDDNRDLSLADNSKSSSLFNKRKDSALDGNNENPMEDEVPPSRDRQKGTKNDEFFDE